MCGARLFRHTLKRRRFERSSRKTWELHKRLLLASARLRRCAHLRPSITRAGEKQQRCRSDPMKTFIVFSFVRSLWIVRIVVYVVQPMSIK